MAVGGAAGPKKTRLWFFLLFSPRLHPRPVADIDLLKEAAFSEMHFFERAPQILKSLERPAGTVGLMLKFVFLPLTRQSACDMLECFFSLRQLRRS